LIRIAWWDQKSDRYRLANGIVGAGIKANTKYRVFGEGQLVEVSK